MTNLLITWVILTLSLWAAARLLPGMEIRGGVVGHLLVSAGFGLLSFFVGWLLFFLIGALTLGLGFLFAFLTRLVVVAVLLKLTDAFSERLKVAGFGTAFLAALIMSGVGTLAEWGLSHVL